MVNFEFLRSPFVGVASFLAVGYLDLLVTMRGVLVNNPRMERAPFISSWLLTGSWSSVALQMLLFLGLAVFAYYSYDYALKKDRNAGALFMWGSIILINIIGWYSWIMTGAL